MDRDQLREALATALRAGQIMLEHGASTARVEETVRRIGVALGAEQVEAFATPTGLFVTHLAGDEHTTRIQRIARSEIDLGKIEAVLAISRRIAAGDLDVRTARAALEQAAAARRRFDIALAVMASALCCGATAGLYGGGMIEIGATAGAAAAGQLVASLLARINLTRVMATGVASAAATGLALALALLLGSLAPPLAMQAAILMLTPGVLIVSAISDLFRGDTISGLARAATALLTVAAMAAGSWLVLALSGVVMALPLAPRPGWALALALAALTTIGFAVLFGVPWRRLPACALAGVVAYAADRLAGDLGAPPGVAMALGGVAVGVVAELLARVARAPAAIFSTPGIITLVPGGVAFQTMLAFAQNDTAAGVANLVQTILLAGALAAGLGVVTAVAGVGRGPRTENQEPRAEN